MSRSRLRLVDDNYRAPRPPDGEEPPVAPPSAENPSVNRLDLANLRRELRDFKRSVATALIVTWAAVAGLGVLFLVDLSRR